jgi:excisionase family DNA binding protein
MTPKTTRAAEPIPALITVSEAANWLQCSRTYVLNLMREGKLRKVPVIGGLQVLDLNSVLAELKARGLEPPTP